MAAIDRIKRVREAQQHLDSLIGQQANVFVIHYSCESFDRPDGRTPRVTSIAIRNFANGQTHSFLIHKVAELSSTEPSAITRDYDRLERAMLDEYFSFVQARPGYNWVHWNMRDINYGFAAIEHRYKVLGGNPVSPDEARR